MSRVSEYLKFNGTFTDCDIYLDYMSYNILYVLTNYINFIMQKSKI